MSHAGADLPLRLLPSIFELEAASTALVILNRPAPNRLLRLLWAQASVRICADGGANRLFDSCVSDEERETLIPDAVIGDLDSVRPEVLQFYWRRQRPPPPRAGLAEAAHDHETAAAGGSGLGVLRCLNQDHSDMVKCIHYVLQYHPAVETVLVLGAFGGRFDQQLGAMNAMYSFVGAGPAPQLPAELVFEHASAPDGDAAAKAILWTPLAAVGAAKARHDEFKGNPAVSGEEHPEPPQARQMSGDSRQLQRMVLVGPGNTAELILPGCRNLYRCHPVFQASGTACGLLPVGKPAVVSSRGLVWDLDNTSTQFGALVSTSNLTKDAEVLVISDERIVWCTELVIPDRVNAVPQHANSACEGDASPLP